MKKAILKIFPMLTGSSSSRIKNIKIARRIVMSEETNIKLFEDSKIRSVWNEEEQQWYFSVVDVVAVLTDSPTPRQYWGKIKDREFVKLQLSPIWVQLKMKSSDGKFYN